MPQRGRSVSENVYITLKQKIENHQYMPGQHLVEAELIELFGCSRVTLRSVFQRLANDGLVENVKNKGTIVKRYSNDDIVSIVEAMQALATKAVAIVASRHDADCLECLQRFLTEFERELNEKNKEQHLEQLAEYPERFVILIADLSGNREIAKRIQEYSTALKINFYSFIAWRHVHYERATHAFQVFGQIFTAITNQDAQKSAQICYTYFQSAIDMTRRGENLP